MALYKGSEIVAGLSKNTIVNGFHLFDFKWSDKRLNDISWLESSTFSWHSGDVYTTAYNKLVEEYQLVVIPEETEGGVTFKRSANGFKIATADMESAILNKYNTTGIAWYYILDTTNKRFKLPRTKFGFEGLRDNVGNDIAESLPNIKGSTNTSLQVASDLTGSGAIQTSLGTSTTSGASGNRPWGKIDFNASRSSSTYQDNAPVQERATQMYLYFYVGEYAREAIEQTAGLNTELFNTKQDVISDLTTIRTNANEVSGKVSKTGDTMTGDLRINSTGASNSALKLSFPCTFGTAPSANIYPNIEIEDINGNRMGRVEYTYKTDGSHYLGIIDKKSPTEATYNAITVGWDAKGKKTYSPVQLITTYVSGASGYNIWSNGYCEQWGRTPDAKTTTVTFLKTFTNSQYCVTASCTSVVGHSAWNLRVINTNEAKMEISSYDSCVKQWCARGYLASNQY